MCKVAVCHWVAVKLKLEIYYIKLFIRNQIALSYLYLGTLWQTKHIPETT